MKELSNEELDRIAAEDVMGWRLSGLGWCTDEGFPEPAGYSANQFTHNHWHPTTCRNQSRMVVEAAIEKTSAVDVGSNLWDRLKYYDILTTTPRQEVEAAILAVRASKGEEPT